MYQMWSRRKTCCPSRYRSSLFFIFVLTIANTNCDPSNHDSQEYVRNLLLQLHNEVRDQYRLPRYELSSCLNDFSYYWITHVGATRINEHSHNPLYGENIAWMGVDYNIGIDDAVKQLFKLWNDEINYFHNGVFPDITFNESIDVGHISQILWRDSNKLGCSIFSDNRYYFLSCNYWPPGNIYNQQVY